MIALAKKYDLYIVCDEEYQVFEFDRKLFPIYKMYDKIITIRSFSKTYAMPGLRLGYVLASELLIHEMVKVSLYTNMYKFYTYTSSCGSKLWRMIKTFLII